MSIKSVKLESPASRVALLVAALVCLAGGIFFAKWCVGNTIAVQSDYKEIAELSISFAPDDPQTHFSLAVLNEKTLLQEDLPKAVAEYEKATALAPNDYRLWLALGKARERSGDAEGAENALRRALALAPNYSNVQWTFGNALLRRGKTDEAFAEIRKSVESDSKYAAPAAGVAWQIFDGNLSQVKQNLGASARVNAALAVFLAKQKRFDEAMEIWNSLAENERKTTFKASGEEIFKELIAEKKYRTALQIQKQSSEAESANNAVGRITNGGFEAEIKTANPNPFDWQIAEGAQPQIGLNNTNKHGGNLSLLIIFNSPDGKDFRAVSQTIAIEQGRKYGFEAFYKSELKTSAPLKWEIVDAADGSVLAATETVSNNADWTSLKAEFAAPENTEAVIIRLARENCKTPACPISGSVWFDDFQISEK